MAIKMISITDIGGFKLGNAENKEKGTGCTVIVCEEGAVGGVDVRGGGPATRETDLLRSENTVNSVNAVVLSGGSAFGLEAASGVMRELADRKIGFDVGDDIVVPIVCGASLYDLPIGDPKAFPDVNMGIEAVQNAYEGFFAKGNHGAGTGATVGKIKGYGRAMKSGLGAFACGDGVIEVGAIAAVNAVGDIYSGSGKIIAGLRSEDGKSIYGTIKALKNMVHDSKATNEESPSFINKSDIDEALAAAARQYEEEKAAAMVAEVQTEEPAEEPAPEADTAEEICEEPAPEADTTEEICEEPAQEADTAEEAEEAESVVYEEIHEEPAEEPYEEFIPETPSADNYTERVANDEVSIPVIMAEPECSEAAEECSAEEHAEENFEEETFEEMPAEETCEESAEETFEETPEAEQEAHEAFEETFMSEGPEPAWEPEYDSLETAEEDFAGEPAEEAFEEEPLEEPFDAEPEAEQEAYEALEEAFKAEASEPEPAWKPEYDSLETAEEHFAEEPAEEVFAEESAEETFEEMPAEEIVEEPAVLTREEMGYDIVFNTTISCLVTNAALTKSQANKLASILHDAYARAIKPVHGTLDGDTVFVLATGKQQVNFDAFAALATDVMQYAIIDGALSAERAYGLPSARDIK